MGSYYQVLIQPTQPTMKAFICAAALLGVAAALPAGVVVAPAAGYANGDLAEPPVYAYNYGVADDYSGANFAQTEQRDGYATSGSYTVNLPDGRIQTVTYSDNGDGIVQDVSYTGEPSYGPAIGVPAHAAKVVAAPVVAHAVHAAPVVAHAVHAAPVLTHAVHAAPVVAHAGHGLIAGHGLAGHIVG